MVGVQTARAAIEDEEEEELEEGAEGTEASTDSSDEGADKVEISQLRPNQNSFK